MYLLSNNAPKRANCWMEKCNEGRARFNIALFAFHLDEVKKNMSESMTVVGAQKYLNVCNMTINYKNNDHMFIFIITLHQYNISTFVLSEPIFHTYVYGRILYVFHKKYIGFQHVKVLLRSHDYGEHNISTK